MAHRDLERRVVELVTGILGATLMPCRPSWLQSPGPDECHDRWPIAGEIYFALTNSDLPDQRPSRSKRTVDAVLDRPGQPPFILGVDEAQHFNVYREITLLNYPEHISVAFDVETWIAESRRHAGKRLRGGNFGGPRPEFAFPDGRHRQRAFRDALTDLLPPLHGYGSTMRIGDFEVAGWLFSPDNEARTRMTKLLDSRI